MSILSYRRAVRDFAGPLQESGLILSRDMRTVWGGAAIPVLRIGMAHPNLFGVDACEEARRAAQDENQQAPQLKFSGNAISVPLEDVANPAWKQRLGKAGNVIIQHHIIARQWDKGRIAASLSRHLGAEIGFWTAGQGESSWQFSPRMPEEKARIAASIINQQLADAGYPMKANVRQYKYRPCPGTPWIVQHGVVLHFRNLDHEIVTQGIAKRPIQVPSVLRQPGQKSLGI